MTAPTGSASFLEVIFNHIALPARLPGSQDSNLDHVERGLIERLLQATVKLARLPDSKFTNTWDYLRCSLETSKYVNAGGRITKVSFLSALRDLQDQNFIIVHVAEQNAALIIRRQKDSNGEFVVFEAFEASPLSEDVLASKNALQWDFPGSSVAIPLSVFEDGAFQDELAIFLEKASIESIKRFAARANKAGSFTFESRNTVDPALITQMLMTLLEVNGRRTYLPLIRKRIRDDVCWSHGGANPWRRSPFWLVLRVAVERYLCLALGADVGRLQYKFLIALMVAQYLDECTLHLPPELISHLQTKLCRRILKLESDNGLASSKIQGIYEHTFSILEPDFRKSTENATKSIKTQWEIFKGRNQRPVLDLPRTADIRHLRLTLPNSQDYIREILRVTSYHPPRRSRLPLYKLPQEYITSAAQKPGVLFAERYFDLCQLELDIEAEELQEPLLGCRKRCIELAEEIETYLNAVNDSYDYIPEQKSTMLLTIMDLWVAMDSCATKEFPLLMDFNSGLPPGILDVLQVSRFKDMCRLQRIREYLQKRHTTGDEYSRTIFDSPDEGCFAERYFEESDDSAKLTILKEHIEERAEIARQQKEEEWKKRTLEFESLVGAAATASCVYTTDNNLDKIHDDKKCTKCFLERKVKRFRIKIHENPLPSNTTQAKAAIFELQCPRSLSRYRDVSWRIISALAHPPVIGCAEPRVLVREYSGLQLHTKSMPSQFCLGSTTKSFLETHYARPTFPVALDNVCLTNGLKLQYFDTRLKIFPGDILGNRPTFAHHCQLMIPTNSPFLSLRFSADFAADSEGPSSNDIIASQTKCPAGLNVHEFLSFQTLFSGRSRRWHQILVELGSSNINFSTEATAMAIAMLGLQIGPACGVDPLGTIHQVFRDESFCERLLGQVDQRLGVIASNWQEANCMEGMIIITLRVFELGVSMSGDAMKLLAKARRITYNWISTLQAEIQTTTDDKTFKKCLHYAFWAALLCRRTFSVFLDVEENIDASNLQVFVQASITLQDNLVGNPSLLSSALRIALIRDLKMVYQMRSKIRRSLEESPDSLTACISAIWPEPKGGDSRKFSHFEFLQHPSQLWVQVVIDASGYRTQQNVHFHILQGHLLIMGQPIGKLPPEWRSSMVLQQLFGNQSLQTYPSPLVGMTYMLAIPIYGHQIHMGFRNGELIIRACLGDTILELIPGEVFGNFQMCDLPGSLIDGCVHWIDLKTGVIEVRHQPNIWRSKPSNWRLDFNTRKAVRRSSTLVDPHSLLFHRITRIFEHFELARNLTVFQPKGALSVELRRLELSFFVNSRRLLECQQLRSEIDPNQDAGTWHGLSSKLLLREVVKKRDPTTNISPSAPHRQRSILVPMGNIKYRRSGAHINLYVENNGDYARFVINDVLGRIDCPAEPRLLYLKAQFHAYTSFILPDQLTGRTGTEEAIHCLKSGCCQPWSPITTAPYRSLELIAKLTPVREYYPKELKAMQSVFWDPHLTTVIQNDGYGALIASIRDKSEQLSTFALERIGLPPLPVAGENHLTLRSAVKRGLYQRSNPALDDFQVVQDDVYCGRDRLRATQAHRNVIECVNLIRSWPTALPTTQDLAGILQKWPSIGSHIKSFDKILLTDLVDIQLSSAWGGIVSLCRACDSSHGFKLMFLFAIMSFRQDINMDTVRTLIAFAVLQDMKKPVPPKWQNYNQFRQNQVPKLDYLIQLIKPSLVPYEGDERSLVDFNISWRQRRVLESAEREHAKQQEIDAKVLAEHFLWQWPCAEPEIRGFSTPVLVDIAEVLQVIRPEWLRLFQNFELSEYIDQVQSVLNHHSAAPVIRPVLTEFSSEETLPTRTRGGEFPSLPTLLFKTCLSQSNGHAPIPMSSYGPAKVTNGDRISKPKLLRETTTEKFSLIRELEDIIEKIAGSTSIIRRTYGEDLSESLRAFRKLKTGSQERENRLIVNSGQLSTAISKAHMEVQLYFDGLQKAFEFDEPTFWLHQGGLWPAVTPVTLLENLRSTSKYKFGDGMKALLVAYALSITALQRLLRIEEAFLKGQTQRLAEEQTNLGHSNWQPLNRPDWLLLEIDSNILICPSQVDVALATISPASGYNSVLQMNMGQGKTSCIMPMAAAALADGVSLLRIIVPKALLLQTAQLLHSRLGGLLGRELRHVPFSRKTPANPFTIKAFHKIHQDAQKGSGVMLALPEHLLSFMLSGLQRLSDGDITEAALMIKVQNWLTRRTRDIIDECDNILALRTQLIYPSGSQKAVDGYPHRWEIAEALLSRVDSHLYNLQHAYPQSIEVVRRERGGFPVVFFLRKDVEDELISRLVDDIYRCHTTILPPNCSKYERVVVKEFISQEKVPAKVRNAIKDIFPKNPALRQSIYLLRGLLVHRILLMTLKKRWNVQYGLHPIRDPIAVPYHAKGTPSEQAEWGHPDVAILFTCLAFYYDGLGIAHLRQAMEHVLKSDDPSLVYDRFSQHSNIPDSLREWSSINVDDEAQLKELWGYFRYNVALIDYFLNNFVFPKHAKQFQIKLQASGWDIPLFTTTEIPSNGGPKVDTSMSLTTGFSGTNDWKRILPLTIKQDDLPSLAHTNAEVLTYLLQTRNRQYVLAANARGRHLTEYELLEKIKANRIRVFIDAGAQILEMDNLSLVKAWLEIDAEIPAAVYFDKGNKPMVLYRQGHQIPLLASPYADDLSDCLVYLDEAHTRGTDLKMPPFARGALTLGPGQTKDHTVQAAMRLRQLGTSQSVTFFSPPEVHQSILDLQNKKPGDKIDSHDVICWLLEQTCNGIEQLQPLYFSQGVEFCRRAQARRDYSDFLTDVGQREEYLDLLRQIEQQTLEQLYGPDSKAKSTSAFAKPYPDIEAFMEELNVRRKGFQDTRNAVHGSALQEVEQEREVAYEVEAVREVQKQVHYSAIKFNKLHRDIISFAKSGRITADSSAYELAFAAMGRTTLGRKYGVTIEGTSCRLLMSAEFTRTVNLPSGRTYDHFQRQVNWILWSSISDTALIIIPEEAEELLAIVQKSQTKATHVITYAAPVTSKMLHFNDLQYYAVPSLPTGWVPPTWLRVELGIYSGRLYFDYAEYNFLLRYLGANEEFSGSNQMDGIDEGELIDGAAIVTPGLESEKNHDPSSASNEYMNGGQKPTGLSIQKPKSWIKKPLAFLQEWLALRRKGQDFIQTPMGFVCQGKPLLENHPFFKKADSSQKEIRVVGAGVSRVSPAEEDDIDEEFYDDEQGGEDIGLEDDDFDDAQLNEETCSTDSDSDSDSDSGSNSGSDI